MLKKIEFTIWRLILRLDKFAIFVLLLLGIIFFLIIISACAWLPLFGATQYRSDPCARISECEDMYSNLSRYEAKLQVAIDQAHACKNGWKECDPEVLACETIWLIDQLIKIKPK
jgi:hypothetical protein